MGISQPKQEREARLLADSARIQAILVDMVNAKGAERFEALIEYFCFAIKDEAAGVVVFRGNSVVATTPGITSDRVKSIKRFDPNKGGYEGRVHHVPLKNGEVLYAITSRDIDKKTIEMAAKQVSQFEFRSGRKWLFPLISFIALASMFIPITESITAKGTVLGNSGIQLAAPREGRLSELLIPYGNVGKDHLIARIENDDTLSLESVKTELAKTEASIRAQGAYATEDVSLLNSERDKLLIQVRKLESDIDDSAISAPMDGIVEWQQSIKGTYVQKGQVIGEINPPTQNNVEATVNVGDWVNLKVGDTARFIDGRDYRAYKGVVASIPSRTEINNTVEQFRLNLILDNELPTGTTGIVAVRGEKILLGAWLFRKQIASVKAYLAT